MSNRFISLLIVVLILSSSKQDSYAEDRTARQAFTKVEKYATQQRRFKSVSAREEQSQENIKNIEGIIGNLTARQLVQLISLCQNKMNSINSDSKHEPYRYYFESVIHFCIRKLGRMTEPEAIKGLDDVRNIVTVDGSMGLVYDGAKEDQAKRIKAQ